METINGYKLLEEKKNSTCGQLAKAQKGRKTYLLKFFHNPVEPNPAVMDEKTFTINHNKFEDHKRRRTQLNRKLRETLPTAAISWCLWKNLCTRAAGWR